MRLVIASGDGRRWKPVVASGQVPMATNKGRVSPRDRPASGRSDGPSSPHARQLSGNSFGGRAPTFPDGHSTGGLLGGSATGVSVRAHC